MQDCSKLCTRSHKSMLGEFLQAHKQPLPSYETGWESMVPPTFYCIIIIRDDIFKSDIFPNKKQAEEDAARKAYHKLLSRLVSKQEVVSVKQNTDTHKQNDIIQDQRVSRNAIVDTCVYIDLDNQQAALKILSEVCAPEKLRIIAVQTRLTVPPPVQALFVEKVVINSTCKNAVDTWITLQIGIDIALQRYKNVYIVTKDNFADSVQMVCNNDMRSSVVVHRLTSTHELVKTFW